MLKPLLIAAVVFTGTAANATPTVRALFQAIAASGTQIAVDHPSVCSDPRMLGKYQYAAGVTDRLTICVKNHQGHSEELRNTVLHEAVHVVQACRNGVPVYSHASLVRASTPEQLKFVGEHYSTKQFHQELEARVIADNEDEVFITDMLRTYCF